MIEEEQYNIALKDEKINAENFALSIKLMGSTPLPVTKERKEIIDAAARIILILKRKSDGSQGMDSIPDDTVPIPEHKKRQ